MMSPLAKDPRSLLLLLCLCPACGDSSGGFDAEKAPYGGYTTATENVYAQQMPGGPAENRSWVLGEKTIGGVSYTRYHIGVATADPDSEGADFWATHSGDTVVLAGLESHASSWIFPTGGGLTVNFDPPLHGELDPPEGEVQTLSASATGTQEGDPTTYTGEISASYTMVSRDATVETEAGIISGCRHYVGTVTASSNILAGIIDSIELEAEVWYHPSFGPVAASVPALGWSIGLKESSDCGDAAGSFNTLRKMATLDQSNSAFELDSYSCSGTFDADKNTHAKLLLELRWLDEDKAKTGDEPGYPSVTLDFGTVFGTFPAQLVKSQVSVFHPEENGQGYTYWLAYVDQAAKNESENGIAYHVRVNIDPDIVAPLRATARIHYKIFK